MTFPASFGTRALRYVMYSRNLRRGGGDMGQGDVQQADLLTTAEAACYCRCSFRLFELNRGKGTGAPFIRLGRKIFYRRVDLDAYIERSRVEPVAR